MRPPPARILCALLLTAIYLTGALNLTLLGISGPSFTQASTADFPCAGHNCGCRTKEQCQTACCCFPKLRNQQLKATGCCSIHDGPTTTPAETIVTAPPCGGKETSPRALQRLLPHASEGIRPIPCIDPLIASVTPYEPHYGSMHWPPPEPVPWQS